MAKIVDELAEIALFKSADIPGKIYLFIPSIDGDYVDMYLSKHTLKNLNEKITEILKGEKDDAPKSST